MCFESRDVGPGVDFELKSNGCSADDDTVVAFGDDWWSLFGVRSDGLDGATESDAADVTGDGDSWDDKYWYSPGSNEKNPSLIFPQSLKNNANPYQHDKMD